MNKLEITKEKVKPLLQTPYINVFDLQYAEGKHYFDASRKNLDDLTAVKSDCQFKTLIPDAVTICTIIINNNEENLLCFYEYRYPVGRFLLSPPAGLIDDCDHSSSDAVRITAVRELFEETGLRFNEETDTFKLLNPAAFSSPGFTDESNAIALLILKDPDLSQLSDRNLTGSELMGEYCLLNKEEARKCFDSGRDPYGNTFSIYTWVFLLYFISDLWK